MGRFPIKEETRRERDRAIAGMEVEVPFTITACNIPKAIRLIHGGLNYMKHLSSYRAMDHVDHQCEAFGQTFEASLMGEYRERFKPVDIEHEEPDDALPNA